MASQPAPETPAWRRVCPSWGQPPLRARDGPARRSCSSPGPSPLRPGQAWSPLKGQWLGDQPLPPRGDSRRLRFSLGPPASPGAVRGPPGLAFRPSARPPEHGGGGGSVVAATVFETLLCCGHGAQEVPCEGWAGWTGHTQAPRAGGSQKVGGGRLAGGPHAAGRAGGGRGPGGGEQEAPPGPDPVPAPAGQSCRWVICLQGLQAIPASCWYFSSFLSRSHFFLIKITMKGPRRPSFSTSQP